MVKLFVLLAVGLYGLGWLMMYEWTVIVGEARDHAD